MKCEVALSEIRFHIMFNKIREDHNTIITKYTSLKEDELNSFSRRQTNKCKRLGIPVMKSKLDKKPEIFFDQLISMEIGKCNHVKRTMQ